MRSAPTLLRLALAAVVASLLPATPSPAQDAPPRRYSELVEVRVVNVEVVVEDARGNRVRGLTPDRFTLRIDGQPVPLEHFAEIRRGSAVARASSPGGRAEAGDAATGPDAPPAAAAGQRVANNYLIFVDDYFAIGAHRNLVLDRLARQLGRIQAPDQAAVVAFGGRDLELLSSWSSSRVDLDRALAAAAARPAWGLMRFSERQRLGIPQYADNFSGFFPGLNEYELRREASALIAAMQAFADAPGRKNLIVLSGGWPSIDASVYSRQPFDRPREETQENDLEILRPVIQTANLLGFTVYPIDLPGYREPANAVLGERPGFDVSWRETAGQQSTDPNVALPANAVPQTFVYGQRNDSFFGDAGYNIPGTEQHREILRQSTLRVVARDTGGRALLGSDRNRPLERVIDDTGSYYWLSFTPGREVTAEPHRIRVEVEGDGYRVRSRREYRDLTPDTRVAMVTLGAAMVDDAARRNELEVTLGVPRRAGQRKVEVPIRVEVPLDRIQFLPLDGEYVADLELRLAAVDSLDRHTEMPIVPIRLRRAAPPAAHEITSFETSATMPRKSRTLALSLYDPIGGKVLLARSELEP